MTGARSILLFKIITKVSKITLFEGTVQHYVIASLTNNLPFSIPLVISLNEITPDIFPFLSSTIVLS